MKTEIYENKAQNKLKFMKTEILSIWMAQMKNWLPPQHQKKITNMGLL
jgi:hypothetical protein